MIKRFGLFVLVNIAVMVTISIVMKLLGVGPYLTARGINYESLMIYCLLWGMGGSFISLGLSKVMAKWAMGLKPIVPTSMSGDERFVYDTVSHLARREHLRMPEVALYHSPEVNAFATGPSRNNSLVAVSTGLLANMSREEVEAVLAHEVSHISNGDMVTMTLVQGVINAFVLFFSKVVAWGVAQAMRSNDEEHPSFFLAFAVEIVMQIVFGLLGSVVVNWFSRLREFRADAGAARLVGAPKMIAALKRLQAASGISEPEGEQARALASFKIAGKKSFSDLFSTHPSLEARIQQLRG